ncbi:MAG: hypothetical protein U5K56_08845 [Halioglobus sp.]|nr:hypothetical protein [Halioglobus sp.]
MCGTAHEAGTATTSLRDYEARIAAIETRQGAYGTELSESLLGLGMALQAEERHAEAVALFKRGVHLARINDGLYSKQQIPLLQAEIASHIAIDNYEQADKRQRYLYRVQTSGMDSGMEGESLTEAFMQHASWQYEAYRLGIGEQDYTRLMNMWDTYRLALNDIIAREGETSGELLPPLYGMLQAQYLIADYNLQQESQQSMDDLEGRQALYQFNAYRVDSYRKGQTILAAIHNVALEQEPGPERTRAAAKALVMLGDWHLWHGDRDAARRAYGDALSELAALEDAQTEMEALFGSPVPVPDIESLRPLPPAAEPGPGAVLIEFTVDERGRTRDIERRDENDELDGPAHRLMRKMRRTTFRPRFEAGEPVATTNIVRAYELQ